MIGELGKIEITKVKIFIFSFLISPPLIYSHRIIINILLLIIIFISLFSVKQIKDKILPNIHGNKAVKLF